MSLAQVADIAHAMLVDQVEARAATDRLMTGLARAMGSKVELVSVDERLAAFEEALNAPPAPRAEPADEKHQMLLRELGVGR